MVTIDVETRRIDVAADLASRAAELRARPRRTLPRVLTKYVAEVSSASEGAVTRPPEVLDVPAGSPQGGSTLGEGQRHG
jgi:dihydroxy-acid dehydratase